MGQDRAPPGAVDGTPGVAGGQSAEPVLVDDAARRGGQGEQVTAVAGRHRPHIVQPGARQHREVGVGVLPGVEDHRHFRSRLSAAACRGGQGGMPGGQGLDHVRELGDVGPVAGVGVAQQRDAAVAGDHQAQPDQPQVRALLLGLAALRDRCLLIPGVDEGGEVGHVQGHRAGVQPEPGARRQRELLLDPRQGRQGHRVHRVPEPAVIQRRGADLGEPVRRRGAPPVREPPLGAGIHHPVQRGQRQVGARRQRQPGRGGPGLLVDDRGHAQIGQQPPRRGHRPEVQVPGPLGQHPLLAGIQQRLHLGRGAHVPLGDHFRLAVHPAHLAQVPVRPAADHLLVQTRHNLGHRPYRSCSQVPEVVFHQGKRVRASRDQAPENHDRRKLGLGVTVATTFRARMSTLRRG